VDDFGVKYTTMEDAQNLLDTIDKYYPAKSVDWTGSTYIPSTGEKI